MFEYTSAAVDKIVSDFKRAIFAFSVSTQALYLCYLVYAFATGAGALWANIVFAVLTVAYLAVYIATYDMKDSQLGKLRGIAAKYRRWIALGVKAFTAVSTVYGIYIATTEVNVVTVSLTAFSVVGLAIQVILELIRYIIVDRFELLKTGFQKDMEPITKPVNAIGNVIRRVKGEEEAEPAQLNAKKLGVLERRVIERRQRKQEEREAKRAARAAKKAIPTEETAEPVQK